MILKNVGHREVVTAFEEDSLHFAAKKMREGHVGDVVVVKRKGGKLVPVGMLTDRDIVVATVALKAPLAKLAVGDVMSASLISARECDGLGQVLGLMKQNGIRRVPLVGKNGELKGIVVIEDILRFLAMELSSATEVFSRQRKLEVKRRLSLAHA